MQDHRYQVNIAWIWLPRGVHPATCCVSGEYPTGLAEGRRVHRHPTFLRQIIHLGLVKKVRMHNGRNIPHHFDGGGEGDGCEKQRRRRKG